MEDMRNTYKLLVERPEWNLGELGSTWEDDIKMDLKKILWEDVDLTNVA
jgi:hypothetical protein